MKVKIIARREKFSTGLAEWSNVSDCVEALVMTNNSELNFPRNKFINFIIFLIKFGLLIGIFFSTFHFTLVSVFPYSFRLCFSSSRIQ